MQGENNCETCRSYSALRVPRVRSDGTTIYGYCFKDGDKDYSLHMGKGFAVFLPFGFCRFHKKLPREPKPAATQTPTEGETE